MSQTMLLKRPGLFFGLFALVTALSLPVWDVLSAYYMHGVVWLVNGGLSFLVPTLRLPTDFGGEGVYPGISGAIALFIVTPHRSWPWKLRWTGVLMGLLLVVHTGVLLAQALHAIEGTAATDSLPLRLLATWGTSVLVIWVWFVAVRRRPDPVTDPVTDPVI